jgi:hypothetical protein
MVKIGQKNTREITKNIIFSAKNARIWRPFWNKMAATISLLVSTKRYNKTRRYPLSIFQVSCNYLVYFLRSNQLYTCITILYLQDFNIFDDATKITITKLPQHQSSNLYKTIFPRLNMVIVHNPIQNKWFNNLSYLSKQIYVGVYGKVTWTCPLWSFFRSQNLKCCLFSKKSCSFSCMHMFVLSENRRLCNKRIQSLIY